MRMKRLFAESGVTLQEVKNCECLETPAWQMACPTVDVSLSETIKGDIAPNAFKAKALEHLSSYDGYIRAYTDGSKTDQGVGCAFVLADTTRSFTLPRNSSVFTAELVALIKVLCFIEVDGEVSYLVLSDSLSCLQAVKALYPSNPLVQEVLQRLTTLAGSGKQVTLCWIPSHVGIMGNELADAAAKRAAARPCSRRFPLPARDFFSTVTAFLTARWQELWNEHQRSKLYAIKPKLSSWQSSSCRYRREEVIRCRLRTGHTYATHGYLLCGGNKPRCPKCGTMLTVKHVPLECPQLEAARRKYFGLASPQLTLGSLLGDNAIQARLEGLVKFIDAAGLSVVYAP